MIDTSEMPCYTDVSPHDTKGYYHTMSTPHNSLVRAVPGSIAQVAAAQGITVAQAWMHAEYGVLVDSSGSMTGTPFSDACNELTALQRRHEGKVAVWSFASAHEFAFAPGGVPENFGGGTALAEALDQLHMIDGLLKELYILCDGEPNDQEKALASAAKFKRTRLQAIHIGPETDTRGRDFMRRLAAACGGQYATAEMVKQLATTVERLMLTGGAK